MEVRVLPHLQTKNKEITMNEITDYVLASREIVQLRREATEALPKASKDLRTELNLTLRDMERIWNIYSERIGCIEEGSDEVYISDRIINRFYEITRNTRCIIVYNKERLFDSPIFDTIIDAWAYWLKLEIDIEFYTLGNVELVRSRYKEEHNEVLDVLLYR